MTSSQLKVKPIQPIQLLVHKQPLFRFLREMVELAHPTSSEPIKPQFIVLHTCNLLVLQSQPSCFMIRTICQSI